MSLLGFLGNIYIYSLESKQHLKKSECFGQNTLNKRNTLSFIFGQRDTVPFPWIVDGVYCF